MQKEPSRQNYFNMNNANSFYIDSCIYLNLWQKEKGNIFGKPFWFIAKEFFEYADNTNSKIYYSGFILKELYYKLTKNEFLKKINLIESLPNFSKVTLNKNEYENARKIEKRVNFAVSFFDIIHLILARKTNSLLITRDKKLIKIAKRFGVTAKKPEEITR